MESPSPCQGLDRGFKSRRDRVDIISVKAVPDDDISYEMRIVHVLRIIEVPREAHMATIEGRFAPRVVEKWRMVWDIVEAEGCNFLNPCEWYVMAHDYLIPE